jgi:hypothetical protein
VFPLLPSRVQIRFKLCVFECTGLLEIYCGNDPHLLTYFHWINNPIMQKFEYNLVLFYNISPSIILEIELNITLHRGSHHCEPSGSTTEWAIIIVGAHAALYMNDSQRIKPQGRLVHYTNRMSNGVYYLCGLFYTCMELSYGPWILLSGLPSEMLGAYWRH